jgi:hypothetical protein
MNTLSEIVMVFNADAWDFTTRYVYKTESLKKLFSYCLRPLQESEEKSVLLYMGEVPWSESSSYIDDYYKLLDVLSEQTQNNEKFKFYASRHDRSTENSELVGNYGNHPFFQLDWGGISYEHANNWFFYAPSSNLDPYEHILDKSQLHIVSYNNDD